MRVAPTPMSLCPLVPSFSSDLPPSPSIRPPVFHSSARASSSIPKSLKASRLSTGHGLPSLRFVCGPLLASRSPPMGSLNVFPPQQPVRKIAFPPLKWFPNDCRRLTKKKKRKKKNRKWSKLLPFLFLSFFQKCNIIMMNPLAYTVFNHDRVECLCAEFPWRLSACC